MSREEFFILSVSRTADSPACVWWRPNACGYTTSIGEAGRYTREEAMRHSDPPHHLVVPCNAIDVPSSRAKYFAQIALTGSRFDRRFTETDEYDDRIYDAKRRSEGGGS